MSSRKSGTKKKATSTATKKVTTVAVKAVNGKPAVEEAKSTDSVSAAPSANATKTAKPAAAPSNGAMAELAKSLDHPALKQDVRVFQIYFEDGQLKNMEPEFIPFDNSAGNKSILEFDVFRRLGKNKATEGAKYWGAMSWRFRDKTMLTGKELMATINSNPGYDLYFLNPETQIEGLYENLWIQGNTAHPQLMKIMESIFDTLGLDKRLLKLPAHSRIMASANYFVGNQKFWDAYFAFVESFLANVKAKCSPDLLKLLENGEADPRNLHVKANYYPFIIERLLTDFIVTKSKEIKCFKIELSRKKASMPPEFRDLEYVKNKAIETKDSKLMAAWSNYRSMVFEKITGAKNKKAD